METIPTAHSESGNTGQKAVKVALGLPKILRRILEHFCDKELIDLSLVNKSWNFEARSILRDRGSLKAKFSSKRGCLKLVEFASVLEKMHVVPFTGIRVEFEHLQRHGKTCKLAPLASLEPSYQVILDRLPCKHLSVRFLDTWERLNYCPALALVKRILEDHCEVLEELSIWNLDRKTILQSIIEGRSFPCLKTLKVDYYGYVELPRAFAKALVSCAPNLEKLYWSKPTILEQNFLEGSSAVVVVYNYNPFVEETCESFIGALKTESLTMQSGLGVDVDMELLNRFVPMFIESNRTTVKTLRMDLIFAVPLMCYGICLENVTELRIFVNDAMVGAIQPHILTLVKAFDFTRVFPKLNKVSITDSLEPGAISGDDISAFVERGNAVLKDALPDRAINIKHLEIENIPRGNSTILLLAQIFSLVETLSVVTRAEDTFSFTRLWENFESVIALHVHYIERSSRRSFARRVNLDSVFCGIFPEEVAELITKDDDYLKAVNIVPVMPSIGCMRGLGLLTLLHVPPTTITGDGTATPMFSKVTDFIGFPRCPNVTVNVQSLS